MYIFLSYEKNYFKDFVFSMCVGGEKWARAGAFRDQKRESEPLKLELQVAVSAQHGCWESKSRGTSDLNYCSM